jgi:hypothetical protein
MPKGKVHIKHRLSMCNKRAKILSDPPNLVKRGVNRMGLDIVHVFHAISTTLPYGIATLPFWESGPRLGGAAAL